MSEVRPPYDDEIDFSELFETIWRGKWIISGFVAISVLSGFVYSQLAQPKFEVSVSYVSKLYFSSAQRICGKKIACVKAETVKHLELNLESDLNFTNKNSNLSFIIETPLSLKTYDDVFDKLNQKLTDKIYNEAIDELNLIKTELNTFMSNDQVITSVLNAKRTIKAIDDGQNAISFGSVAIKKMSPIVPLILLLSIALGGMIGVVFVLVKNTILKRKESAS